MNRRFYITSVLLSCLLIGGCKAPGGNKEQSAGEENLEAKKALQGIWVDEDSEDVLFRFRGDSIFYPDSTSVPASFKVVGDTLVLSSNVRYPILKRTDHLLWFRSPMGEVHTRKSEVPSDSLYFTHQMPQVLSLNHVVKTDSVVRFDNKRYHCYVYVNPTKKKVVTKSYTSEGLSVNNVYYDNVVHICVYEGANCLYSSDYRKDVFESMVPADFISESILSNVQFVKVSPKGFHFYATLAKPDGGAYYLIDVVIAFDGSKSFELVQ
ncbi:MAG: DUF4738 domain-containing protein [Bacteroidaceae bacterium]|nr:DUF4738 domain-containing protein [Bacteroidaceae bacterium]